MTHKQRWDSLVAALLLTFASGAIVHAQTLVRFDTNMGSFDVRLFDDTAPETVANFLNYVVDGDYVNSIVHRSVPEFVIQGGGFYSDLTPVPNDPPIENEFGASNLRGTIAMAKLGGDPDSANSQWFINLVDNPFLDNQNGGFTVFGEVTAAGMSTVDQIGDLDLLREPSPFGELPIKDASLGTASDNLVTIRGITVVPEPSSLACALTVLLFVPAVRSIGGRSR